MAARPKTAKVPTRIAPRPVASAISVREESLPPASCAQIEAACDFHCAKAKGQYGGPATRALFDLSREVKALLQPIRRLEEARMLRLNHLEEMLEQYAEVFQPVPNGELASPVMLREALVRQKELIGKLVNEVRRHSYRADEAEERCLQTLADLRGAHLAEMEREARRYAEAIGSMRELCDAKVRRAAAGGPRAGPRRVYAQRVPPDAPDLL